MVKSLFAISLVLMLIIPLSVYSQKEAGKDTVKTRGKEILPLKVKIKYADALFQAGNYYDAIEEYAGILDMKPDNINAMYQTGECYFMARDYVNAEAWYAKVADATEEGFPLAYYRLAMMQKMNGKYEEAKYTFAKFALRAEGDYITRAKREIEACDFAKNAVENPTPFTVTHLGEPVNSPYSEYAPATESGKLYFSSLVRDTAAAGKEKFLSHVYLSAKNSKGWKKGELAGAPFNSDELHTGNLAFSPDGRRAYFTQCTDNGERDIRCAIVMSVRDGKTWTQPVPLGFQRKDDPFTSTHPAVATEDSLDIVYFSSNRPGGSGGNDLWYVEIRNDGSSSEPVNLGSAVNTIDDEVTPFFSKNKLYFSSTGHVGMGGLDIFVSSGMRIGWSKPQNLGYPLNSSADDLYFTKGESSNTYYFVSNRPGIYGLKSATCCDDIFMADDLRIPKYSLKGKVIETADAGTQPLTGARVEIFDITAGNKVPVSDKILAGDSEFTFEMSADKNYEVKVQKKGYFPSATQVMGKDNADANDIAKDFVLGKLEKKKAYKMENIYYESNKSSLTDDSKEALQALYELLVENPKLVVEISAHTDDVGKGSYNIALSQQRAESCVDYLIYLGIEENRLVPKGYGESMPVAPNKNRDGSDNEEGKQQNRRTEFKIIGELSRVGDKVILD